MNHSRVILVLMTFSNAKQISTAEAAQLLGVSYMTVTRWIHSGYIVPAYKSPGARPVYGFDRTEVERLAANRRAAFAVLGRVS